MSTDYKMNAREVLNLFSEKSDNRKKFLVMIPMEHIDEEDSDGTICSVDDIKVIYKSVPNPQFEVDGEIYNLNEMITYLEKQGVKDAADKVQKSLINNEVQRMYFDKDNDLIQTNESYRINKTIYEGIAKDGIGKQREKEFYKYIVGKNKFRPTGNIQTVEKIPSGIYKVGHDMQGLYFDLHELKTDEILSFEDVRYNQVLNEINEFWSLRDNFNKMGFTHKRGIMLYGPPGTGKSCLLKLAMAESVKEGNIVLVGESIRDLHSGVIMIKDVEPNRKLLAVAEDVEQLSEHSLLQILDGDDQLENFLFLTTTNYIERIPPRVLRPSRIDRKIEVLNPPATGRRAYFKNKFEGRNIKDNVEEVVALTDGFSFAQLREFMVSVYCLKQDKKQVSERIRKNFEVSPIKESFSPAVLNAISKPIDPSKIKSTCPHCGFNLPSYPGRYPVKCPGCGNQIGSEKEEPENKKMTAKEVLDLFSEKTYTVMSKDGVDAKRRTLIRDYNQGKISKDEFDKKNKELKNL